MEQREFVMTNRVEEEIGRANQFGDEIQNLVVAKGQCPAGERDTLLIGYWSLAFGHHKGVLCLL